MKVEKAKKEEVAQRFWYLGFLGLVGIYELPQVISAIQAGESLWALSNLLWLLFLTYQLQANPITIDNLSRKWTLEKYSYLFFSEDPAPKERNDYILLKSDLSFESVSEAKYDSGKWRLDTEEKRIYLSKKGEDDELIFIIHELTDERLILIIDDSSDSDTKNLKIHFKN